MAAIAGMRRRVATATSSGSRARAARVAGIAAGAAGAATVADGIAAATGSITARSGASTWRHSVDRGGPHGESAQTTPAAITGLDATRPS